MAVFSALRALTDLIAQSGTDYVLLGSAHPEQPPMGWGHTGWLWLGCDTQAALTLTGQEPDAEKQLAAFCAAAPPVPDDVPAIFMTLGYQAAGLFDPAMAFVRPDPYWPALQAVTFKTVLGIHLKSGDLHVVRGDDDYWQRQWWRCLLYAGELPAYAPLPETPDLNLFQSNVTEKQFADMVKQTQALIKQGEFYQANLSVAFNKTVKLSSPMELFWHSQVRNPSPFSGVWQVDNLIMLCNSPERLITRQADGKLITRPIAGTRGPDANALLENPKERAEHAMLVDLQRNDLGKISLPETVNVSEWLTLETYSHVSHLVSQVESQVDPGVSMWQLLSAVFPGGTITGCPKNRCMQAIETLEPNPRGWYTGSMGWLNPTSNTLDLNILIRCLWLEPLDDMAYNAHIQTGAGIVTDSVAQHEYRECIRKAALWLGVVNTHNRVF